MATDATGPKISKPILKSKRNKGNKETRMRKYSDLPFWGNIIRSRQLEKYQSRIQEYFNLVDYDDLERAIIDNQESKKIRRLLNKQAGAIEIYIIETGLSPCLTHIDAPAMGSRATRVNVIDNLFNLQYFDIEPQEVIDIIDRALGVYEKDFAKSVIRAINPIFWLGRILELISSIPFYLLGRIGFNQQKLEESFIGRLVKLVIKVATLLALTWELLARLKMIPETFDLLRFVEKVKV